jgi:hypothetical protein
LRPREHAEPDEDYNGDGVSTCKSALPACVEAISLICWANRTTAHASVSNSIDKRNTSSTTVGLAGGQADMAGNMPGSVYPVEPKSDKPNRGICPSYEFSDVIHRINEALQGDAKGRDIFRNCIRPRPTAPMTSPDRGLKLD